MKKHITVMFLIAIILSILSKIRGIIQIEKNLDLKTVKSLTALGLLSEIMTVEENEKKNKKPSVFCDRVSSQTSSTRIEVVKKN